MRILNIKIVLFFGLLLLFSSSCKKEEIEVCEPIVPCREELELGEPVIASPNCEYWLKDGEDELSFEVIGINDSRAFGGMCSVSTGGFAEVHFITRLNGYMTTTVLNMRGCQPPHIEYEPTNAGLPSYRRGNYIFRLMRVYPQSLEIEWEDKPSSLEGYTFRMVLLKD